MSACQSPTDTFRSVRDRIARFESLQDTQLRKTPSEKSSESVVATSEISRPELGLYYEDDTQGPLSPSIESEISQAEVKSSSSYNGEDYKKKPFDEWDYREKREVKQKADPAVMVEKHEKERNFEVINIHDKYPIAVTDTTVEKTVEVEQQSHSSQSVDIRTPHVMKEQHETSATITSNLVKPEVTEKAEIKQKPPELFAVFPSKDYEESQETTETQECRTVKKTVTKVTTTRYIEMPEETPVVSEEEKSDENEGIYSQPFSMQRQEQELESQTMARTITTVTTTKYIETPNYENINIDILKPTEISAYQTNIVTLHKQPEQFTEVEEPMLDEQSVPQLTTSEVSMIIDPSTYSVSHLENYQRNKFRVPSLLDYEDGSNQEKYIADDIHYPTVRGTTISTAKHTIEYDEESQKLKQDSEISNGVETQHPHLTGDEKYKEQIQSTQDPEYNTNAKTITKLTSTQHEKIIDYNAEGKDLNQTSASQKLLGETVYPVTTKLITTIETIPYEQQYEKYKTTIAGKQGAGESERKRMEAEIDKLPPILADKGLHKEYRKVTEDMVRITQNDKKAEDFEVSDRLQKEDELEDKTIQPTFGERFAVTTTAPKRAGGAVVAPVALAAMGAAAAYEAITRDEGRALEKGEQLPPKILESIGVTDVMSEEYPSVPHEEKHEIAEFKKQILQDEPTKAAEIPIDETLYEEYPRVTEEMVIKPVYDREAEDFAVSDRSQKEEGLKDKTIQPTLGERFADFATTAAKIAGGAVVAPVALAAMGATAAYEAMTRDEGRALEKRVELPPKPLESIGEYQTIRDKVVTATQHKEEPIISEYEESRLEAEPGKPPQRPVTDAVYIEYPSIRDEVVTTTQHEVEPGIAEEEVLITSHYEEKPKIAESEKRRFEAEPVKQAESPTSELVYEKYSRTDYKEKSKVTEYDVRRSQSGILAECSDSEAVHEQDLSGMEEISRDVEYFDGINVINASSNGGEDRCVIKSESYCRDSYSSSMWSEMKTPQFSPTQVPSRNFMEDRIEISDISETDKREHLMGLSQKDDEQHVIESKYYDVDLVERRLSSPVTSSEQFHPESPFEEALKVEIKTLPNTSEEILHFVGTVDDVNVQSDGSNVCYQEKQLISSSLQKCLEFELEDHSEKSYKFQETPLKLMEEALKNVVKIKFTEVDELESPEKQSIQALSSYPDEQQSIAGDELYVYDKKSDVLEEYSDEMSQKLIAEAESSASVQNVTCPYEKMGQASSNDVTLEPEVDYQSDLQEKLDILAEERRKKLLSVQDHSDSNVHFEYTKEIGEEHEIEKTASHLADEAIKAVIEVNEDAKTRTSTSESNMYHTATEHSKDDQYDSCVTSQDTYDSAQEWTSQESDYTTAASGATSRLSGAEERQGSVTPLAILSPVDSDRQFTANQDFDDVIPVIKHFGIDDTARSTPDVPLQVTIEEEEEDIDNVLPVSHRGVLLPPDAEPGRPSSPIPPIGETERDQNFLLFMERPDKGKILKDITGVESTDGSSEEKGSPNSQEDRLYSRQHSNLSLESHAETVIHFKDTEYVEGIGNTISTRVQSSELPDSLDKLLNTNETAGKRDILSQQPTESLGKVDDERKEQISTESTEVSPSSDHSSKQRTSDSEEGFVICPPMDVSTIGITPAEGELETVEEEPEDIDSINGSGNSSVGVPSDTLALIGKYKHVSSDNVSLTSLQEFERLEQVVINRGEGSLSSSELELYAAGKSKSSEGSVSSLTEFEKLEQELAANISPQEDVAMLPDIREESEVEDMSVRDDDEEEHSETEVKTRPIDEEDLRTVTPIASPVDSLEREPIAVTLPLLETSTDSLEPSYQHIETTYTQRDSDVSSLAEYEVRLYSYRRKRNVVTHFEENMKDSLENIPHERDSLLEGASQEMTSQDTHGLLSGDTVRPVIQCMESESQPK
ncbi:putative phage head-tail adaptor [Dictyocaulus viviparus]|uniref:Putative phage head-tail adaptor n=1 Tax=Dictyocaulus viviparus TaxID=29172 RepID=A0A0D8XYP0_DICVI|nr:putative phage head-tail adaptor [Dictyocaulus viviparus]